ncbi:MAG: hypothetical protein N2Z79_01700, partial [Candidatus Omnitrophica bacterium]|nr:hypothetical protein [Candidatus Omnitrophota bacterium]
MLKRFVIKVFIFCVLACFYVYQQIEIVRLGYINEKKRKELEQLLDYNHLLRYNLNKQTSLVKISGAYKENSNFQRPKDFCLIKVKDSTKVA